MSTRPYAYTVTLTPEELPIRGDCMTHRFNVTYEVVTPESAEHGDAADRGFELEDCSLRDAIGIVGRGSCEDSGRWFSQVDGHENYRTGEHTSYSVHPPEGTTAASYGRLRRLFCERRTR